MNTKMNKLALASAIVLGGAGFGVNAYAANLASSTATATLVAPISITTVSLPVLSFGKFAPDATLAKTVTISNSGARSGTATLLATGVTTAARFDVTGQGDSTYTISLSADGSLTSGANTMALAKTGNLDGANDTAALPATGTLSALGAQSIYVGGTLTVGAAQAPGTYTGEIAVTVNYN